MRTILVFGSERDRQAWNLVDELEGLGFSFIKSNRPDDVLLAKNEILIMDVTKGIDRPLVFGIDDIKKRKPLTLHDFDLGFFLRLMKDSDIIDAAKIIGVPELCSSETIEEVRTLLGSL
jgi:hypothetical protein